MSSLAPARPWRQCRRPIGLVATMTRRTTASQGILPDGAIRRPDRRRRDRHGRAAGRERRCSRRASTCGSARRRRACARAFCPARISPSARSSQQLGLHEFRLADGAVLETGCVYIVPLLESLDLPADIAASANPKSSTGRLDVFTRVITDKARAFDKMAEGYSRSALPGDQPAHLSDPRAHRLAAVADPLPPRQRAARRRGAGEAPRRGDAGERHAALHRRAGAVDRPRGRPRRPRRLSRQALHGRDRRRQGRRL